MSKEYFGTDGIRGQVGSGYITPEFALKLGWAAGTYLKRKYGNKKVAVVIAKDTRLSGYLFEYAMSSGFVTSGVQVYLLGPMPTPAVAYFTRAFDAQLGVVISASHNLHQDNGIKFFCADGVKMSDEDEGALSNVIEEPLVCAEPDKVGRIKRIDDARGRYIEFCKSAIPPLMSLSGFKLVLDCAHGATYHIAPEVFRELGAEVIAIGVSPNGLNINKGCGSCNLGPLREKVVETKADLGIAFDGDGDRVMMVDHLGNYVNGDQILYLLALDRHNSGLLNGGIVGTVMTNMAIEVGFAKLGIDFIRSKVGDRYVMEQLLEQNWHLGGESSGHIISLSQTTTGDGIVAALQVIAVLQRTGKKLSSLLSAVKLYPQKMVNIKFSGFNDESQANKFWKYIAHQVSEVERDILGKKDGDAGEGRVLIRASGTEPLIRVMVEAKQDKLVDQAIDILVKAANLKLEEK